MDDVYCVLQEMEESEGGYIQNEVLGRKLFQKEQQQAGITSRGGGGMWAWRNNPHMWGWEEGNTAC